MGKYHDYKVRNGKKWGRERPTSTKNRTESVQAKIESV